MRKGLIRQVLLMMLLVFAAMLISGCWDRKEIEDRGWVLGVAIDKAMTDTEKEKKEFLYTPEGAGDKKYLVTLELPKFRKEASKELSSAQQHLIWAAEGESMFAITRAINTKVYFGMFYEDIQIMIFSEEVAKEGIGDIIDFWLRDSEIRRKVYLFVAPGRAEDILKAKLQVDEVNSLFIAKLMKNADKSPYFSSKAMIGEISKSIRNKHSFMMPLVMVHDKEVKLARAVVFNSQQKMIGELDEQEIFGTKLIRRELKEGVVVVPNPTNTSKVAVFELYEADIEVKPYLESGTLRFVLEAKFVGTMGENQNTRQDALDPHFTRALEEAIAVEYTSMVKKAYSKQQALQAEVSKLNKLVYDTYPDYWKSIREHWDEEVFPQVPLEVNIKVLVRRPVLKR